MSEEVRGNFGVKYTDKLEQVFLPCLRWSLQQISCLHLSLSVVCSPVAPNICPLNLLFFCMELELHHIHFKSLPSCSLPVWILISSAGPRFSLSVSSSPNDTRQQVHSHLVGFPFTPAATPKMQQNICLCADHLQLGFIAGILTNPLSISSADLPHFCANASLVLWFCWKM